MTDTRVEFFRGELFGSGESKTAEDAFAEAYAKGGVERIASLRGAFAAAIKDGPTTILVRDQFGIFPLYYHVSANSSGSGILYSTSVLDLLSKGVPRKLSSEGLLSYLSYGCLYAPYTMVEGVMIVPPGCAVTIVGDDVDVKRYWTPSFDVKEWKPDELQEAVTAELLRAVREQTVAYGASGIRPAAFLSGGLDSSSIVWRRQYDGEIRTYCVTHEDARTDERKWARMVAERNGTIHTELALSDSLVREWLDEAAGCYDQPSLDGLNFWFATKLLKETTSEKLMLSGEGGDELFMGYGQFIKHQLAYKYAPLARYFPRFVGATIDAVTTKEKYRKLAMLAGFKGDPYYVPRRILSDWQISRVLNPDLLVASTPQLLMQPDLPLDLLNRISWLEMQTVVADMWMRDGFQTSAHNGISLRTPICDVRLAELLYTVPGRMKCDECISKPLLVRAAGYGIPEDCVMRKKSGFSLPFDRYFTGELKDRIDEFLSGNTTRLFRPDTIRKMGRQYKAGRLYWNRIWELFMVEDWCQKNKVTL